MATPWTGRAGMCPQTGLGECRGRQDCMQSSESSSATTTRRPSHHRPRLQTTSFPQPDAITSTFPVCERIALQFAVTRTQRRRSPLLDPLSSQSSGPFGACQRPKQANAYCPFVSFITRRVVVVVVGSSWPAPHRLQSVHSSLLCRRRLQLQCCCWRTPTRGE